MIRYCPHCWAENAYEAQTCAACGASLVFMTRSVSRRLPDSMDVTTAVAHTLGLLGALPAVPGLAVVLLDGTRPLPARLAAAEALAAIGGPAAQQALADAAALAQLPHLLRRVIHTIQEAAENR